MPTASADGVIYNTAPSDGGIGTLFSPDNLFKINGLQQINAFRDGVPTDATGNPDYMQMAKTLYAKGAFSPATELLGAGVKQAAIKSGLDAANSLDGAGTAGPAPATGAMPIFQKAISGIESGGDYAAQGPVTDSGDRAYGKYQVMGANIPTWTKEVLGSPMTPQQFLSNPQAQDAVFNSKFGSYLKQYGTPQDAASMWFTGQPYAQGAGAKDGLGTTGAGYVTKFLAALPRGASSAAAPAPVAADAGGAPNLSSTHPYGPQSSPAPAAADDATPAPVQVAGPGAPSPTPASPAATASPSAIDPTLGGLLKGKWVGDPGGYMTALRANAVRLGTLGNTPAATAFNQQATMVENALTRSETPEVKNYAVALRQGYTGSMMDFARDTTAQAEAAKIAAQGSPMAVRAAGQKAQAEADARNSAEVAAASQKAEQEGEGKALGQLPGQLATSANQAQLQSNLVDQMLDAAGQFRMGPGATTQQNLNSKLIALGDLLHVEPGQAIRSNVAGFTDFNKLAGQLTRQSIKDTGSSRAGIQEMQMVASSLPSPDMNADGFRTVANQLKGLSDFTLAKQQAGQAWMNKAGTMRGFEADWNKNVTPAAFVLHRLQVDQPDLFASTVQRMATTPQGRGVLSSVKSGLAWGGQQGLF